jgi:cytochrome c oxidase cbb3-type subunit 3
MKRALIVVVLLCGCKREQRELAPIAPASERPDAIALSDLHPGPGAVTPKQTGPYDENAFAISEGRRLFAWYNCTGCHSHGGGGMGPALMDDEWIYGDGAENIYETIVQGRPNGMPAFRGRISDDHVWKLVAYVRSLSGQLRSDAVSARSDALRTTPAPNLSPKAQPKPSPDPTP